MAAAAPTSTSLPLREYLKRYESGAGDDQKKRKRKKKEEEKPKTKTMGGILVVDEDPVWQKAVQIEEEPDSADEEKPQIDEDIEVKRMKRLEAIRARKPYHAINEDGSGWVPISDSKKPSDFGNGGGDLSPQRKSRGRFDTPSPEPEKKPAESGEADLSPPRQRQRRVDTPSPEPGTEPADIRASPSRKDLSNDLSPPRRGFARLEKNALGSPKGSSEDISPPRRPHQSSNDGHGSRVSRDSDPHPNRSGRKSSRSDLSLPRKVQPPLAGSVKPRETSGSDLSPTRKRRNEVRETQRAGLFSGNEIKEEIERKKKEDKSRFASMDPMMSGKGAAPVFRDKEGKRISREEIMKAKEEEKPKDKKLEWGKGLAQKRDAEAMARELELEKDKPFARTRDDPDLDKEFKERIRWGDPMAHLVKQKNVISTLRDLGDDEKMKESGFIVPQGVPNHSWLKRGLDFPPNRFGIKPGRHWDGVDRSNGYEKDWYKRQNEKRATEQEAYLWSVSEM